MKNLIVKEIIEECGGHTKLAEMLGISRQATYQWVNIPAEHVERISELTGRKKSYLRPDIFNVINTNCPKCKKKIRLDL